MVMGGKAEISNGMTEQYVSKLGALDGLRKVVQGDDLHLPRVGMDKGDAGS
jgi:hypothetical protein